jgi:TP901 family phage tail tape measure protein
MDGLQYSINFTGNAMQVLQHVNDVLGTTMGTAKKAGGVFGDCWKNLMAFNQVSQGLDALKNSLADLNMPGIALNKNMQDLSAITGISGKGLDAISNAARQSAKAFGTDAAQNVESYKIILSKLDPKIAESTTAMKLMGDNVNILSKSMGGDTVASASVLTTAMNQFGISTKDPIKAGNTMADMMNIMAAAAQAGSAELPEIGKALENVGMLAKTTGVSFAETNAAIQVLDKAGAKGAEGGIALRNILASMSAPSAAAKDALDAYGISTKKLADPNITLSEKLKLLKPAMGDVAAMNKIFEKANIGAAIAMIKNTDSLDEYTKGITGTTSAQDQAKIVMNSYEERMKRQQAKLQDLKIGFFNATESMQPYLQATLSAGSELGKLGQGISAVSSIVKNNFTKSIYDNARAFFFKTQVTAADGTVTTKNAGIMGIGTIAAKIYKSAIDGISKAMGAATGFTKLFGNAIKGIPVIGWIAAAIGVAIAAFKYLWNHSRKFREVLFGIWEAAKAVFHNIGVVLSRVWNAIIKPIATAIYTIFKTVFTAVWNTIQTVFNAIVGVFKWLWNTAKSIVVGIYNTVVDAFNWIYDAVASVFNAIGNFFSGIWNWFKNLFKGFVDFINEWIINPIKNAFNGLMDFFTNIFNWIKEKLKALIQPLIDLYNYIFGEEGMQNVNDAIEKGREKGGESFDKDHPATDKPKDGATDIASGFNFTDIKKGNKDLEGGGVASNSRVGGKEKNSSGGGSTGGGSKTIHSLTINKLIENLTIHTTNLGDTKEKIRQQVTEALLTSVNDFNLSTN